MLKKITFSFLAAGVILSLQASGVKTPDGSTVCFENTPLKWNVLPSEGTAKKDGGFLTIPAGRNEFSPAKGVYLLKGRTPDQACLLIETASKVPFKAQLHSYGRENNTVVVKHFPSPDRHGVYWITLPLEKFADYPDRFNIDRIVLIPEKQMKIRRISFRGMNDPKRVLNLIHDPGFEHDLVPAGSYAFSGDFNAEENAKGVSFDTARVKEGKRSLRIAPGGKIVFTTFSHTAAESVFSFWACGGSGAKIEAAFQLLTGEGHGAEGHKVMRKTFDLSGDFKRFSLVSDKLKRVENQIYTLYRVTLSNPGKIPVYADALQLEPGRTKGSEFFKNTYSNPHMQGIGCTNPMKRYEGMTVTKQNEKTGRVPFTVFGASSPDPAAVRGGIPFEKGVLYQTDGCSVTDKAGNVIPAQFCVLARRPLDGSILSLCVDFTTSLPAGKKNFILKYGPGKAVREKPLAAEKAGSIFVDTGKLKFSVTPGKESFLDFGKAYFAVETPDGKVFRSLKADLVKLEENGPQSCMIFLRGKALFAWEIRIRAYRDLPYCRIDCSFENNYDKTSPQETRVRSIYLHLPGRGAWRSGALSGKGKFSLVQRMRASGEFSCDAVLNGKTFLPGTRLAGSLSVGKSLYRVKDFFEMSPRGFASDADGIRFFLWPDTGVSPLSVPCGFSSTLTMHYAPEGGHLPGKEPRLIADASYVSSTKVFRRFLSGKEERKRFPKAYRRKAEILDAMANHAELTKYYSPVSYGDFGSQNYTYNHETSGVRNLWSYALQNMDPAYFDLAEVHACHERDVDLTHVRYGCAGMHTHTPYSHFNYNYHTGHYWISGVVRHYLLTGDRRSLDSVLAGSVILQMKARNRYKGGRERWRIQYHLAEIYELCGQKDLRDAWEYLLKTPPCTPEGGYYGAIRTEALAKLHEVTGDPKYRDRLQKELEFQYQRNQVHAKPMPENRSAGPTMAGAAEEGRSTMMLHVGAQCADLFNEPRYTDALRAGRLNLLIWYLFMMGQDHCAVYTSEYMLQKSLEGVREDPATPDSWSFLARMLGYSPITGIRNFEAKIFPGKDGKAVLDVYRQRRFRYWQSKRTGDIAVITLKDSSGRILKTETLDANLPAEHRRLAVQSPDGKPVAAHLSFRDDCWGGVSSPGRLEIKADGFFAFRSDYSVPAVFRLRVPASGRITVKWQWMASGNASSGTPLAVMLKSPDGKKVLAGHCWIIPHEYGEKKKEEHACTLSLPQEWKNKEVKVYVSSGKWIGWSMTGLDYPWFWN